MARAALNVPVLALIGKTETVHSCTSNTTFGFTVINARKTQTGNAWNSS